MAELTPQGDKLGDLFPVRVTELGRVANIRDAVELLYYGNLSGHSLTAGQEDQIPTQSIAGQLRDIGLTKLDKTNGVALGNFTVSNGASPFIWLQGTTNKFILTGTPSGGDKTITFQNASGTLAFTNETSFTGLIAIDSRTDQHTFQLAYGDPASGNTKTVNLGTTSGSALGATSVNIGASAGSSRTVGINGTTTVNGSLTATGATQLNSTLGVNGAITGSSTVQGTSFIFGSGPTFAVGSGAPGTSPSNGSLYVRTDGANTTTLYARSGGTWSAVRGNMWFSGTGAPGTLTGQQVGDFYVDRINGKVYQLS
jgi:hypothetical protein